MKTIRCAAVIAWATATLFAPPIPGKLAAHEPGAATFSLVQFPQLNTHGPYSLSEALAKKRELESQGWTCFAFAKNGAWWVQAYKG